MYGKDGKTEEINLRNKTDNFEKGHIDKFKVNLSSLYTNLHWQLPSTDIDKNY